MNFIKAIWELPQNILGAIVKKVCKAEYCLTYKDAKVYTWNISGGMSLGKYIFAPFTYDGESYYINDIRYFNYHAEELIKHEYGHTIQSKYLGWLYLLVIGLPSLIWAQCFQWYWLREGKSYYDFYPEKWANKLGGVEDE